MGPRAWLGRRSAPDTSDLAAEGLLHVETVPGSATYRHFRSPARRSSWRKEAVRWTVALTRRRFVVRRRGGPMVDVAWADPRVLTLQVAVDGENLLVGIDPAVFHDDRSGRIEVRARCADPRAVVRLVESLRAHARR